MSVWVNTIATIGVVMFFVFFIWVKIGLPLWNDFKKQQIPITPYDKNRKKVIDVKEGIHWEKIEGGRIK